MEQNLKTINIKGKDYCEVNERINYFRTNEKYAGWTMVTEVIELNDARCVLKAIIRDINDRIVATGIAQEDRGSSLVNETSYIENCETSAWGRALANLGIGIRAAVASAEEVSNAIRRQSAYTAPVQQPAPQNFEEEIKVFDIELDGQYYAVEYVKKFSKKNNRFFWALVNEDDAQFFPKYQKYEG